MGHFRLSTRRLLYRTRILAPTWPNFGGIPLRTDDICTRNRASYYPFSSRLETLLLRKNTIARVASEIDFAIMLGNREGGGK